MNTPKTPRSLPKATLPVTANQLDSLANDLADFVTKLRNAAKIARTQPNETLGIFNWPSVPKGLTLLRNFVAKADESRSDAELGRPLPIGQLKPRSTMLKKPPPVAEIKTNLDAKRKAAKKKRPS